MAIEPVLNVVDRGERERFLRELDSIQRDIGRKHNLLIAGKNVPTQEWVASVNPARPSQIIGEAATAGIAEVERAVAVAQQAQGSWGRLPVHERIALLRRAAQMVRARRGPLTALVVLEVGKTIQEADADIVETIEYLDYYAARLEELSLEPLPALGMPRASEKLRPGWGRAGKTVAQRPGEANRYMYQPRGVTAVIAPWNFPAAILMGMASAALAMGNVVILKPSEQSTVIAAHLVRLLHEAGFPGDVVQFLPGRGEVVGAALVAHPAVRLIMFTGSKSVGLKILEQTARVTPEQRHIKHAVVEMGGKNALIVDEDADLDAAVKGIITSAFGYAGQKCSALSRLIVHEAVYDQLIERLQGAADSLVVGDPSSPDTDVGPLIEPSAVERLAAAAHEAEKTGRALYRYPASRMPKEGYFSPPVLVTDLDPKSRLAQEELFGPLLCIFRVKTVREGIQLANDCSYGLTGGIYSRSPSHIQEAADAMEVGNFYVNRPITGALVGYQPFGGYKLSGLGTKAGGPDYLLSLAVPKTISENTTRHGTPLD